MTASLKVLRGNFQPYDIGWQYLIFLKPGLVKKDEGSFSVLIDEISGLVREWRKLTPQRLHFLTFSLLVLKTSTKQYLKFVKVKEFEPYSYNKISDYGPNSVLWCNNKSDGSQDVRPAFFNKIGFFMG